MKQRTIGVIVLVVMVLATLTFPQGFAKGKGAGAGGAAALPATSKPYSRTTLSGVSNAAPASPSSSPSSCGNLGFQGKFGTLMYSRAGLSLQLQHTSPNTQYSVWLGYKTSSSGCDGSWQELGRVNTNASGSGGYHQALPLAFDTQYQVVVRDQAGNTIYATAFFSP